MNTDRLWGLVPVLAFAAAAVTGGYYWWQHRTPAQVVAPAAAPAEAAPPPPPSAAAQAPEPALPPLPTLAASDGPLHEAIAQLIGVKAWEELFHPDRIVHRIVATVDNLPRAKVSTRVMPVKPVPGVLRTAGAPGAQILAADNAARYAPYVKALTAVSAQQMVDLYRRYAPLFQQAYAELGYPKADFEERLLEAIDDALEAPQPSGAVALRQPNVLYTYADPDLEGRSAGQKMLLRMGPQNAAIVRARLGEIRALLRPAR